jgi:stress response protein YsnF
VPGLDIATALDWRGRTVVDRDGERIGTLKEIYLDEGERPGWGSIHTGLFGLRETLVPLSEAQVDGDQLRVPYEGEHVKDAPNVDPDVQLTADEEELLYRHYGYGTDVSGEQPEPEHRTGAVAAGGGEAQAQAERTSPATDDAGAQPTEPRSTDDAMTRSEEEVRFGKRTRERERVRLKKYVVTDYVEKKVPVKREEVRLEREPPEEGDERAG